MDLSLVTITYTNSTSISQTNAMEVGQNASDFRYLLVGLAHSVACGTRIFERLCDKDPANTWCCSLRGRFPQAHCLIGTWIIWQGNLNGSLQAALADASKGVPMVLSAEPQAPKH